MGLSRSHLPPSTEQTPRCTCHRTGHNQLRGVRQEIDFSGLHLDTKTHIASQWDEFIDTKTTYNHFLNMKLKCTIGLPSTPLRFACATHRRSWTEHMGRARICHSRHESTCAHDKGFLLPTKGTTQLTSKAQHAKLWKRSRSHNTGGTRYGLRT